VTALEEPDPAAPAAVDPRAGTGTIATESAEPAGLPATGPGVADIQAAVIMVERGLADRIVLAGFPSWPGLLWQAYQLAEAANLQILPTIVHPGGTVDIVIERVAETNG
jgi:hypothetical protein